MTDHDKIDALLNALEQMTLLAIHLAEHCAPEHVLPADRDNIERAKRVFESVAKG